MSSNLADEQRCDWLRYALRYWLILICIWLRIWLQTKACGRRYSCRSVGYIVIKCNNLYSVFTARPHCLSTKVSTIFLWTFEALTSRVNSLSVASRAGYLSVRTAEGASEKQSSLKARLRNGLTYLLTYLLSGVKWFCLSTDSTVKTFCNFPQTLCVVFAVSCD